MEWICENERKIYSSFDDMIFLQNENQLYFQLTKIPCEITKHEGFRETNIYRMNVEKIPIFRFYVPQKDSIGFKGTDYYFIPFEENHEIISWKGYCREDFSEKIRNYKMNECHFEDFFRNGGNDCQCVLEHIFSSNYQWNENDEDPKIWKLFYSQYLNVHMNEEIDDFYTEFMIKQLYELIMTSTTKDKLYAEKRLYRELLGEYGKIENRGYLFKIAEMNYSTFIKMK